MHADRQSTGSAGARYSISTVNINSTEGQLLVALLLLDAELVAGVGFAVFSEWLSRVHVRLLGVAALLTE